MARLRRQAYALEEAGIIAAEAPTLSTTSSTGEAGAGTRPGHGQGAGIRRAPVVPSGGRQQVEEERTTNGGLGNLDVGFLNSRGARVGGEKEEELVGEARRMLENLVGGGREKEGSGEAMEE